MAEHRAVLNRAASVDGGRTWHIAVELQERARRFSGYRWRTIESKFLGWNYIDQKELKRTLKMWGLTKKELIR